MATIYLAGKMSGLSWEDANGWRDWVTERVLCKTLSPMRGKDEETWETGGTKQYDSDLIIARDLNDVSRSDLVFCWLHPEDGPSVGTLIELGYALALRKPVVLVTNPANPLLQHPFIKRFPHMVVCDVLSRGVEVVNSFFPEDAE